MDREQCQKGSFKKIEIRYVAPRVTDEDVGTRSGGGALIGWAIGLSAALGEPRSPPPNGQ